MSKFNDFGKRLDKLAKDSFAEFTKAEEAYKKAKEKAEEYPQHYGWTDAAYESKRLRAAVEYREKEAEYKAAKNNYEAALREVKQIRTELESAIEKEYTVNPEQLDSSTVELMKSGVLKPADYVKIMDEAKSSGNHTMIRLITKYAEDAIKALENSGMEQSEYLESRARLNNVISVGKTDDGHEYLEAFDFLADVYQRSVNNPAMISYWDQLTAYTVENL